MRVIQAGRPLLPCSLLKKKAMSDVKSFSQSWSPSSPSSLRPAPPVRGATCSPVLLISALFNPAQLGAKPVGQAAPLDQFVDDLEPASEGGDCQVKGVKMALALHGNGSTLSSLWTGNLRTEETLAIRDRDTLNALLDSVERFVRERLVPAEHVVAETDEIPEDIVAGHEGAGLFGLTIPEEYGGLGLTMEEEALVIMAMGQTSPAFRSLFGTTVGIGSQGILLDGLDWQKRKYLPKLATGEILASFALTEPEAGSDAASLRTTAARDGDFHVVNGTKRFITNAPHAGIFTLMARTDHEDKGPGGVTAFIVERNTPGISIGKP